MDIYSTIAEEIAKFKKEVPNSNALFYVDLSPEIGNEEDKTLTRAKVALTMINEIMINL